MSTSNAGHVIGDDCPGGHYADPGTDGSCCRAAQATNGDRHAWNCGPTWQAARAAEQERDAAAADR